MKIQSAVMLLLRDAARLVAVSDWAAAREIETAVVPTSDQFRQPTWRVTLYVPTDELFGELLTLTTSSERL